MRLVLCQVVLLSLASSGCFVSHGREDSPSRPVPPEDASTPVDASTPPRDTEPPTPVCVEPIEQGANRGCLPDGLAAVPPNTATTLSVFADGCFCDQTFDCEVSQIRMPIGPAASGIGISLTTQICPNPDVDCDGCVPSIRTDCELPPLDPGVYPLIVDGRRGSDLIVGDSPFREALCLDFAPEEPDAFTCVWPGGWAAPMGATMCLPTRAPPGQVAIRMTDVCQNCFSQPGECFVTMQGDVIQVQPSTRTCECPVCGACEDRCTPVEIVCHTPPLQPGLYRVVAPGGFESPLEIGPVPGEPPEVCLVR